MPEDELARVDEGDSAVGEKYDACARSSGDGAAGVGSCVWRVNCGGGTLPIGKRGGGMRVPIGGMAVPLSPVGGLNRRLGEFKWWLSLRVFVLCFLPCFAFLLLGGMFS